MNAFPLLVVLLLLFLAAILWAGGERRRRQSGLPSGDIVYDDTGTMRANTRVLHAADLRLAGKPDYLVEQPDGSVIPVELKSGTAPSKPWAGQVLQLAAYCLLVEANYGVRPPHGILQYSDKAYAIPYTAELENNLLDLLDEMRTTAVDDDVYPDHDQPQRCARCGVRDACDYRLDY